MKYINNIVSWFVADIINCDDDYDFLELQMMEDMYLCWLDITYDNNKEIVASEASLHG